MTPLDIFNSIITLLAIMGLAIALIYWADRTRSRQVRK